MALRPILQHIVSKDSGFCVTCILHLIYPNQFSADMLGHDRAKYVRITLEDPEFMKSKEAFVGMVIQGAEEIYARLKRYDGQEDSSKGEEYST